MKFIQNLNIYKKAKYKLAACALVGSLATTTLTGCGDETVLLKGTVLENTCVITFDDNSKDIAVVVEDCLDSNDYKHYRSIVSGSCYGCEDCTDKDIIRQIDFEVVHHYAITNDEVITKYLTLDELDKAIKGKLNDDDITNIINRIIGPSNEKTNVKTK